MYVRLADDRGVSKLHKGAIVSQHTFSFADYWDEKHCGFSVLKVMNDDVVDCGEGFDTHGHKNMEILTYVLSGELTHEDSLGHKKVLKRGEAQLMSAGSGVQHSEFNRHLKNKVHLYQIWIEPNVQGTPPTYQEMDIPPHEGLKLLASPAKSIGTHMQIKQDAFVFVGHHARDGETVYRIPKGRKVWIQVLRGEMALREGMNERSLKNLSAGDGVGLSEDHEKLHIQATESCEFLLFNLPA